MTGKYAQWIILALVIIVTAFLLQPVQRRLSKALETAEARMIDTIEERLGRKVTYKSISPSIFRFFQIKGLVIHDEGAALLSASKVRVYYRLSRLIRGDFENAVYRISFQNSNIVIQEERDEDLLEMIRSLGSNGGGLPAIDITGRNIGIRVETETVSLDMKKVFLSYRTGRNDISIQFKGGVALSSLGIAATLQITGKTDASLSQSDFRVRIKSLSSNIAGIKKLTFQVNSRDSEISIRKIQDKSPLDLLVRILPGEGQIQIEAASEDFVPSDYLTVGEYGKAIEPWLDSVLTMSAFCKYDLKEKTLAYGGSLDADVRHPRIPVPVSLSVAFSGDKRTLLFDQLAVDSGYGKGSYEGTLDLATYHPDGELVLSSLRLPSGYNAAGKIDITDLGESVRLVSDAITLNEAFFTQFETEIFPSEGEMEFVFSTAVEQGDANGYVDSQGTVKIRPDLFMQASLAVRQFPLETLVMLAGREIPRQVTERLDTAQLSAQLYLTTNFKELSYAVPYIEVTDRESDVNRVTLGLAGDRESIEIFDLQALWNDYSVEGLFTSSRTEAGELAFETFFYLQGIPYSFDGFYVPQETFILHGDYSTDVSVLISKKRTLFRLITRDLPVPFPKTTSYVTLNARGVYVDPSKWEILSDRSSIRNLPLPGREEPAREDPGRDEAEFSFSARLTPETGQIYQIVYEDQFSTLIGNGDVTLSFPPDYSLIGWIQMEEVNTDPQNKSLESYTAMFSLLPDSVNAELFFTGSPIGRVRELPISGTLRGNIDISGPLDDLIYTVNATMNGGRLNDDPFSFQTSLVLSGQNLNIENLDVKLINTRFANGRGTVDLEGGSIIFETGLSGIARRRPLNGTLSVDLNTTDGNSIDGFTAIGNADYTGKVTLNDLYFGGHKVRDWEIALTRDAEQIEFTGGPDNSLFGTFKTGGDFEITLTEPLPLTLVSSGTVDNGILAMQIDDFYWDFSSFARLELIPYFSLSEGIFTGSAVVSGPFNDPDFNGVVRGSGVIGSIPLIPDQLGPIEASLVYDGKTLSARNLDFPVGQARVVGDLVFEVDHWIPRAYDIRVRTVGDQGVRIKDTFFNINADGYGNGDVVIIGDRNGVEIGGTVVAETFAVTLENIGSGRKKRDSDYNLAIDLDIITGSRIEFFWPTKVLPIMRATAAAGEEVAIDFDSVKDSFSLVGDIGVQGGQVYYFSRNFYLNEGFMSFNENQDKFDPRLTMRAEIYEVDEEGERVKIAMVLEDTPLSQFSPKFESEPILSNAEIFALLGQDLIIELGGEDIDIAKALLFTGDVVSQFSVMRTFEDRIKQLLKLDLFSVRTQMLENIVLEKVLGDDSIPLGTGGTSFGKYFDNTTIIGGKQLGKDLFLEATIRLNSKNVYISDLEYFDKLEVESEISIEWETPIALLELTFKPEVDDFVSSLDNTNLALSWRFSF